MLSTIAALVLCLWVQAELDWLRSANWLGWPMEWTFVLMWPGIALARWNFSHTWIVVPVSLLFVTFFLAWRIRRKPWITLPAVGTLLAIGCCLVARLVYGGLDIPTPDRTPYDSDAGERQAYLEVYKEGYRFGASGCIRNFCFMPEPITRGWYAGLAKGTVDFNRIIGRKPSPRDTNLIRRLAATDGVRETSATPRVERAGAAQPATRSESKAP